MSNNNKDNKSYKLTSQLPIKQQLYEGLSKIIIHNFDKINEKEIEPTIQNIHENIFEEDFSIVINDLVNFYFKEVNEGKDKNERKQHILDCINNFKINLLEICNWLLNNQNDPNSIYLLGYFNCHGIGMDVNKQNAFELYQKAVELENNAAQFDLAILYMDRNDVDNNLDKTFELSKTLAKKEYPGGINLLGYCYDIGIGTDVNTQKAFELYQMAAKLGNSHGINNLGCCYDNGIGTNVNKQKAIELYQKAANLGNDIAQYNLALMYECGDGIKKDVNQAIYWYKKSADQGYEYAQNKLKVLLKE
jgi:TPR repeat protein